MWSCPGRPAGPTDAVARVLSQEISETLRQPVVIDNKAGATGVLGSDFVAKAAPDGYTIVVAGTASHSLAKIANAKLPYDPLKDFRPIIEYGRYPVGIFVGSQTADHQPRRVHRPEQERQGRPFDRTAGRRIGLAPLCATAGVKDRRQADVRALSRRCAGPPRSPGRQHPRHRIDAGLRPDRRRQGAADRLDRHATLAADAERADLCRGGLPRSGRLHRLGICRAGRNARRRREDLERSHQQARCSRSASNGSWSTTPISSAAEHPTRCGPFSPSRFRNSAR